MIDVLVIRPENGEKTWECSTEAKARSRQSAFQTMYQAGDECVSEERNEDGTLKRVIIDVRKRKGAVAPAPVQQSEGGELADLRARVERLEAIIAAAGITQ